MKVFFTLVYFIVLTQKTIMKWFSAKTATSVFIKLAMELWIFHSGTGFAILVEIWVCISFYIEMI